MGTADAGHYISYANISTSKKDQKEESDVEWLKTEGNKWWILLYLDMVGVQ
jgi:hypothetical protein